MNATKRWFVIPIFLVCWLAMLSSQGWAITISFDPLSSTIGMGDTIDIDINIDGLDNANLAAFDLNVNYDAAILRFDSYMLGDHLGDLSTFDAADWSLGGFGGGLINLAEFSFLFDLSFQPDIFTLATVSFTARAAGDSLLTLSDVILSDEWGSPLITSLVDGRVSVSAAPVPEPGTMLLMLMGIGGLSFLKRKRA